MYINRCNTMNTSDFFHQINLNFQAFLDITTCKLTFCLCFNAPFCKGNSNHAGFCVIEFYGSQIAPNCLEQRRSVKSLSVFLRFLPHGAQQKENLYSLHDLNPKNQLPNIPANYLVLFKRHPIVLTKINFTFPEANIAPKNPFGEEAFSGANC